MKNSNRTIGENLSKVVIISEVPKLAKLIVDSIPDLTYERYIRDYKALWNIALPAAALVILKKYEGSELERTFIACMSAGISRAINEKARESHKIVISQFSSATHPINNHQSGNLQVKDCLDLLDSSQFSFFMTRLASLPEEQRNGVLNLEIPSDENIKELIGMFNTLAKNETLAKIRKENPGKQYSLDPGTSMKVLYIKFSCLDLDDELFRYFAQSIFSQEGRDRVWQKAVQKIKERGINVI